VLVLAFDTSSPAVTVAIVQDDRATRSDLVEIATNRHGELLAPLIRAALDEAGVAPRDLSAIGVGLGPGPFTGLRVGIVTAKAMGDALGIPTYGVCSLDVIAEVHGLEGGPFAVLSDARRKQVYWALYGEAGERLEGPEIGHPGDVADLLRGRTTMLAGAGAALYADVFSGFDITRFGEYPGAIDLGWLVTDRLLAGDPGDDLTPLYLRRPDAQPPGQPKRVTPV
jgi:tRNA threonylcarbamoyl adenosine modification protein YeaZ